MQLLARAFVPLTIAAGVVLLAVVVQAIGCAVDYEGPSGVCMRVGLWNAFGYTIHVAALVGAICGGYEVGKKTELPWLGWLVFLLFLAGAMVLLHVLGVPLPASESYD